jgi:hypothetical protein
MYKHKDLKVLKSTELVIHENISITLALQISKLTTDV